VKALIAHRSGEPRLVELDIPPAGRRNVVIRVTHLALQIPDEQLFLKSIPGRISEDVDGLPLGGLCSGIVESVGPDVKRLREGLRVAAWGKPYVYHAQYLSVPESNCVELPKRVSHEEGAFTGAGVYALKSFRRSECSLGSTMVLFGGGMMSLLLGQIALASGVRPILVEPDESKRTKARNVGLNHCLPSKRADLTKEVLEITGGAGADALVYTLESPEGVETWAEDLLRTRGVIIQQNSALQIPSSQILTELEARILLENPQQLPENSSRWSPLEDARVFLELLNDRKVQITPLITDRTPIDRAVSLYEKIARTGFNTVGAVLTC
jgi:NADPH:quinone reductase-like Zn-dependent oxidoreductase